MSLKAEKGSGTTLKAGCFWGQCPCKHKRQSYNAEGRMHSGLLSLHAEKGSGKTLKAGCFRVNVPASTKGSQSYKAEGRMHLGLMSLHAEQGSGKTLKAGRCVPWALFWWVTDGSDATNHQHK
jgi:hypothetical protein